MTQERETVERHREELEREKARMSSMALRLKTRTQEVEAFSEVLQYCLCSKEKEMCRHPTNRDFLHLSWRPRSTRWACGRCRRRSGWRPSTRPGSQTSTARRSGCGCRSSGSCRSVLRVTRVDHTGLESVIFILRTLHF